MDAVMTRKARPKGDDNFPKDLIAFYEASTGASSKTSCMLWHRSLSLQIPSTVPMIFQAALNQNTKKRVFLESSVSCKIGPHILSQDQRCCHDFSRSGMFSLWWPKFWLCWPFEESHHHVTAVQTTQEIIFEPPSKNHNRLHWRTSHTRTKIQRDKNQDQVKQGPDPGWRTIILLPCWRRSYQRCLLSPEKLDTS